jgi:hypothetical protein
VKTANILSNVALSLVLLTCEKVNALQAHVTVAVTGTNLSYTLSNDESAASQAYLDVFHLEANAPFTVLSTPAGWDFRTDNFTYVDWFCTNTTAPYPNDIAPGVSLSGFTLQSKVATLEAFNLVLISWDHGITNSGSSLQATVQAPSVTNFAAALTNALISTGSTFDLDIIGVPRFSYAVQSTENFSDWKLLTTNPSPFTLQDTNWLNSPMRFYRAFFVPDEASSAVLGD